jgi:hypothetical protein
VAQKLFALTQHFNIVHLFHFNPQHLMKNALVLSVLLFGALHAKAQVADASAPNPNAPEITFVSETVDYGTIEHNANGEREFVFTNTGKEPLIISNCKGSCGCTVPVWPKTPIAPGEKASIKVKYDTSRQGQFNKQVTVTSNAKTPSKVLNIRGNVKAAPQTETVPVNQNAGSSALQVR